MSRDVGLYLVPKREATDVQSGEDCRRTDTDDLAERLQLLDKGPQNG